MDKRLVLVTGANGYIAGKLVPCLLASGNDVRCMVRDPQKIAHRPWINQVDVVVADVTEPSTLRTALDRVDTAYYLIHNMSKGHGYQRVEVEGANHFAEAATHSGARHIIYLGGLADPKAEIAPHMRSRIETGDILRKNPVPVTEFRAGVIVGPGSISFEMIRYLCEQFPFLVGPPWLRNRTQPISADNVVDYLMAALENPGGHGQVFEIGGPEIFTYAETMLVYAECRNLKRTIMIIPALPTALMAQVVDKLTPVPAEIAYPLIDGLHSHSTVTDPTAIEVFPNIHLTNYRQAIQHSLAQLHPTKVERIWDGMRKHRFSLRSEGFLIYVQQAEITRSAGEIYPALVEWAENNEHRYTVEAHVENSRFLLKEVAGNPSTRWVDWELVPGENAKTKFRQTSFTAPKGLPGFLSGSGWKFQQKALFQQIRRMVE